MTLAIALWRFGNPLGFQFPKWEFTWECDLSHSPTFPGARNVTPMLPSWHTPLQAFASVASPRLGLRHICSSYFLCLHVCHVFGIRCILVACHILDVHHVFNVCHIFSVHLLIVFLMFIAFLIHLLVALLVFNHVLNVHW